MTNPAEARRIEQRSLRFGIGANAMGGLGLVFRTCAHRNLGPAVGRPLFSRVGGVVLDCQSHQPQPGAAAGSSLALRLRRPGSLVCAVYSLVLLGVIGFGVGSSCSTLIDWWRGNSIAPLHLEPVALYTALMTALCGLLAWRHRRDWRRTGRVSLLLLTEARNARIEP